MVAEGSGLLNVSTSCPLIENFWPKAVEEIAKRISGRSFFIAGVV
jgi:hypothetical protein